MPEETKQQTPAQKRIEELRSLYSTKQESKKFKGMMYGKWGSYKSSIAATMPRPILFHTFDPGGETVKEIQDGVAIGDIIVDSSWQRRALKNTGDVFQDWNNEYNNLKRKKVFDEIGTYVLDSFTTFQRLVIDASIESSKSNKIISSKLPFKVPQMRDYGVQDSTLEFVIADMLDLPCHVLVIAHAEEGQDENEMLFYRPMIVGKKLREKIPMLFDEIYVTKVLGSNGEVLTSNQGMYDARSRLRPRFGLEGKYKNRYSGEFNMTRDILVPAGLAEESEIVEIADPEDVQKYNKKDKRR